MTDASLVERIEDCLTLIHLAPGNKKHVLELYTLLKEVPRQTKVMCGGIKLLPPRVEFYARLGDRYNFCLEQSLIFGHRYSLLDLGTNIHYTLYGFMLRGAVCFEMWQKNGEEPLRTMDL